MSRVVIEDESYQKTLIFWVRREMLLRGKHLQIIPVRLSRAFHSVDRMKAIQPFINNGEICFANSISRKAELLEEFMTFPKGPHDDLISALAMVPTGSIYPGFRHPEKKEEPRPRFVEFLEKVLARHKRIAKGRFPHVTTRSHP